jgi:IS30 family transposase
MNTKTRKHLERDDRNQIEILLYKKYKQKEIAFVLGYTESTISREIQRHRCQDEIYRASVAQHKADIKRRNSKYQGMKIQQDTTLQERIVTALQSHQSPDGIAGRLGGITAKSIYKWLYSIYGQQYCKLLCTKRYKAKKRRSAVALRQMIQEATSIHERIDSPYLFEGDLFVSPTKQGHSTSVAIFVHRQSQYITAYKMDNRRPNTMVKVVNRFVKNIRVDSITFDRGIENKYHREFPVPSYFCDPHSPWQKPYVENNIGLLRKWFVPKKTDLRCMTQKQLQWYISIVNRKWRKSLGYMSAEEKAKECGIFKSKRIAIEGII